MLLGQSRVFYSMSNDGLLPKWAATIHPRFRTPWISSITVGLFVAFFAALIPIGVLGQLVNIGTLLAFIIVCAGVWILRRRRPDLPRPFRTPWVPFVPVMGMVISFVMMAYLPLDTWLRLLVWLAIGMGVYFGYGRKHSRVHRPEMPIPTRGSNPPLSSRVQIIHIPGPGIRSRALAAWSDERGCDWSSFSRACRCRMPTWKASTARLREECLNANWFN